MRRQAFKFQSGELLSGAGHSGDAASQVQRLNDLLFPAAHLLFNISDVVRVVGADGAAFNLYLICIFLTA